MTDTMFFAAWALIWLLTASIIGLMVWRQVLRGRAVRTADRRTE